MAQFVRRHYRRSTVPDFIKQRYTEETTGKQRFDFQSDVAPSLFESFLAVISIQRSNPEVLERGGSLLTPLALLEYKRPFEGRVMITALYSPVKSEEDRADVMSEIFDYLRCLIHETDQILADVPEEDLAVYLRMMGKANVETIKDGKYRLTFRPSR